MLSLFFQNMWTAAQQVIILYMIVLVGFVCSKTGIYTPDTAKKTTDLLFYIVTVTVIVKSFSTMTFSKENMRNFIIALIFNFVTLFLYIFITCILFRKKSDELTPIFRYAIIYGNCAYMGIPLTEAILGDEGVFYASTGIIAFNVVVFIHGIKLMTKEKYEFGIKKIFINPGFIGIAIGLPLFLFGAKLPDLIQTPLNYIAGMNTPLAMVIFGTYLASTELKTIFKEKKIYLVALFKLIVDPLIVLLSYRFFGLRGTILTALIITAAVPSANNTIMFAAKYDRDTGVASKTVSMVNIISVITLPAMIALSQLLSDTQLPELLHLFD